MDKIFIEKPKKPACLQIQNIGLILITLIILSYFDVIFLLVFIAAMVVFYIYDLYTYKHMPPAILYTKNRKLFYFHKRVLTEIALDDIDKVSVREDTKKAKYIQIQYTTKNVMKEVTIKSNKAEEIVKDLKKSVRKVDKMIEKENKAN